MHRQAASQPRDGAASVPPPDAATRDLLTALFRAALARVDAADAVRRAVRRDGARLVIAGESLPDDTRLVVLAAGKAAAPMAAALEDLAGERIARGLAVTKDGHGLPLRRMALREAAHPVPDARGEAAAREALALVETMGPREMLVLLLSGGASALLSCPVPALDQRDLAETTAQLLTSGATIDELNVVRRHLCAVAGGRLALHAACARIHVLAISDVLGDSPAVIGSGPCAADASTWADALAVIERRALRARIPAAVLRALEEGAAGRRPETPRAGDPALTRVRTTLLATNRDALDAASEAARARGLRSVLVSDALRGEAREAGRRLAALARALPASGGPYLLLAGGETTVTVRGDGRGGRCQELALAGALYLQRENGISLLAAGTDGSDGPTDAAGAFADGGSVARGAAAGVSARECLARNDAHAFFRAEGGLFVTGPTGTNVMDVVLVHVSSAACQGGAQSASPL